MKKISNLITYSILIFVLCDITWPKINSLLPDTIKFLNAARDAYNNFEHCEPKLKEACDFEVTKKDIWWQMIQLLPTSYNQKRTIQLNYEVLGAIYHQRRHHKLDEWHVFCDMIETLPYSEFITREFE